MTRLDDWQAQRLGGCRGLLAAMATLAAGLIALGCGGPAAAHDFRIGAIVIDHPYAVPSLASATTGAAYLRTLKNNGSQPDRLLGASTPVAQSVEIQRSTLDGQVMHMRVEPAIDLPAGSQLPLRHGGPWHLVLIGLKQPLANGDSFALTLRFERAGDKQVNVVVQTPRDTGGPGHAH